MKQTHRWLALLALLTLYPQPSAVFAQGSLTPPGAPAPGMKSLDQVEPRSLVNAANTPGDAGDLFVISQPGSYYLTANLAGVGNQNGIAITTNNVTLDLNGFTLSGGAGLNGIIVPGVQTNIVVRNGTISGWSGCGVTDGGTSSGIGSNGPTNEIASLNLVFEHLNVSSCAGGICLSGAGIVRDCNCGNNAGNGIKCLGSWVVSGCTANHNGIAGIYSRLGLGASLPSFTIVSGCTVQGNVGFGIVIWSGTVSGCLAGNNGGAGIDVEDSGSLIVGNTCVGNNTGNALNGAGIFVNAGNNRIEDNHVTANLHAGIFVSSLLPSTTNNIVIKNSVNGNGASNYIVPAGQVFGPLITDTGTITNASPWANFSY